MGAVTGRFIAGANLGPLTLGWSEPRSWTILPNTAGDRHTGRVGTGACASTIRITKMSVVPFLITGLRATDNVVIEFIGEEESLIQPVFDGCLLEDNLTIIVDSIKYYVVTWFVNSIIQGATAVLLTGGQDTNIIFESCSFVTPWDEDPLIYVSADENVVGGMTFVNCLALIKDVAEQPLYVEVIDEESNFGVYANKNIDNDTVHPLPGINHLTSTRHRELRDHGLNGDFHLCITAASRNSGLTTGGDYGEDAVGVARPQETLLSRGAMEYVNLFTETPSGSTLALVQVGE
jgi:hypothetical protein